MFLAGQALIQNYLNESWIYCAMWWEKLKNEILDTDLYTRSGTEVGVSGNTLRLEEKNGDYFPVKVSDSDIPEISYRASSDLIINYPELNRFVFSTLPQSWLIGNYKKIFVGHITDEKIRRNSSSGGILSGIQLYLLRSGKIDGAITLRMRHDKPYLTEPIIAQTEEEIIEGAQSKYTTAPLNQILARLPGNYKSLSYTGLPEQIASIRKLQMWDHASVKPIKYILGFFYGEALGFSAIKSFLKAHGEKSIDQIKSLSFRAGEWPGYLRVELKNGRIISIKKFYANYLSPSHITKYSLYQVDYMSELADISSGDAWSPVYEERGKGWSVVVARTQKGLDLLEEMRSKGEINLKEITEKELIDMHSLGLDVKKRGAFIRIARRRARGLPVPEFGYEPINISISRKFFETFVGFTIWLFHLKLTIWILEKLPVVFIGKLFVYVRTIWKKCTKTAKKEGLKDLKFKVNSLKEL